MDIRKEDFYNVDHPRWKTCPVCNVDALCLHFIDNRYTVICDNCASFIPLKVRPQDATNAAKFACNFIDENGDVAVWPRVEKVEEVNTVEEIVETAKAVETIEKKYHKGKAKK